MIFPPGLELKSFPLWADKQIIVSGDLIKDNTVDFVKLKEKINLPDSHFFKISWSYEFCFICY